MRKLFAAALVMMGTVGKVFACQPPVIGEIAKAMLTADAVFVARPVALQLIEPEGEPSSDGDEWEEIPFHPITVTLQIMAVWQGEPPTEVVSMNFFYCPHGGWAIGVPQLLTLSTGDDSMQQALRLSDELALLPFLQTYGWGHSRYRNGFDDHRLFFDRITAGQDPVEAAKDLRAFRSYLLPEPKPFD